MKNQPPLITHLPPPSLCSTVQLCPSVCEIQPSQPTSRRVWHAALHISRSPPAIYPSPYLRESGDSKVDSCHMPELQLSNPRTRLRSEQRLPQESSQPLSTRQKLNYPRGSQPPAAFWDNLSKIWLSERALKELDRRNTQPAPSSHRSLYRQSRRPVTRLAVAEWRNKEGNWEPTQPAADFLIRYSAGRLEDMKLLARHGGPDLSDLRGVCITRYLLRPTLTILFLVPERCHSSVPHNELEPV
jgi:hypothetical protein